MADGSCDELKAHTEADMESTAQDAFEQLDFAVKQAGINFIDTAELSASSLSIQCLCGSELQMIS